MQFYLHSRRDQFFLLFAPGYAAEVQLKQKYLQEALDHQRSLSVL